MSKIIEYAEKYNIPLTKDQKDKLISLEIMLNLSDIIVTSTEKSLTINAYHKRYYIYKLNNDTFSTFFIFGNTTSNIIKNDLTSAIEFCINDLKIITIHDYLS